MYLLAFKLQLLNVDLNFREYSIIIYLYSWKTPVKL